MFESADSALELIGNTPLVHLRRMALSDSARVLAKVESQNPSGSVKDRIAMAMVKDAEKRGLIQPGDTIVEASAGNTGIALAMVAAARGYDLLIVMPEGMSMEPMRHLERFGALMYLTPTAHGMAGAHQAAQELTKERKRHVSLAQFSNPVNVRAHKETTAREIIEATHGRVDAFVAGVGTGGTIVGVGQALKEADPKVQIVAVEPSASPLLSRGWSGEHNIPGLGANFVPPLLQRELLDRIIAVSDQDAWATMERLSKEEGLLAGVSSGANVFAALQVAQEMGAGKQVVTILPDGGERYLRTI